LKEGNFSITIYTQVITHLLIDITAIQSTDTYRVTFICGQN